MYTVNQGQKLATVGCYIMVTLPRAQGTHVKVGSKVLYLQYYKYVTFHEQQECGYGFPSLPLATRASADVSE